MRRISLVVALLGLLLLGAVAPADVVDELVDRGFYVEAGADVDEGVVADAVAEARFAGGRLHVVVLSSEPAGGATVFADAVLDRLGAGTVFVVAPETVGWASQEDLWTREQLDRALDAALRGSSDREVVEGFVAALTGRTVGEAEPVRGGGGGTLVVLFLVVVGVVGLLVWRSRAARRRAAVARLAEIKQDIAERVAAVSNDIVELDPEIAVADHPEARRHFEAASEIYGAVERQVGEAATPSELIAVVGRLDEAIWHLDAAEALLDGEPVPPRPEPLELGTTSTPTTPVQPSRRPGRRSRYASPELLDVLLAVGAAMMSRGGPRRRGFRGYRSTTRRRRRRAARPRRSRRMRGGGRRR